MFPITYGYELEVGDIHRSCKIPEKLGSWEYAECDIVNLLPPYANIATDPLGLTPPVGGEVNIFPGHSPEEVADRVMQVLELFQRQGDSPTASCVNHGHVHVRLAGLRDDIKALKRATGWINDNQTYLIRKVYGYEEYPLMRYTKTARIYLKWDGGRPMPSWMASNIINQARDFNDFIRIQCCGKDGKSRGRPFRYAINTYCMKHTDTIEFRFFRASLKYEEILGSLRLVRDIVHEMLSDNPVDASYLVGRHELPKFYYDHNSYVGWENTKHPKERGRKERYYRDIV
jgi:hypothetical protein